MLKRISNNLAVQLLTVATICASGSSFAQTSQQNKAGAIQDKASATKMEGGNHGGGGAFYPGKKPSVKDIKEYLPHSAVRVLGYLNEFYNYHYNRKDHNHEALLRFFNRKIKAGVTVEFRESGPCFTKPRNPQQQPTPSIASINSPVADICFSPNALLEQSAVLINRHTFYTFVDAMMAHEILHLAQQEDHQEITEADEDKAIALHEHYIETAERGGHSSLTELTMLSSGAGEILRNGFVETCSGAHNYLYYTEYLLTIATDTVISNNWLISQNSELNYRIKLNWKIPIYDEKELNFIVENTNRGSFRPTFIGAAQVMKDYFCNPQTIAFQNYKEQGYSSKDEMYNKFRDLMVEKTRFISTRVKEIFSVQFKIVSN